MHANHSPRRVRSNDRPISPLELPLFWEAETAALKTIPHSGKAVIHDSITDLDNIHPENKRVPGERLALLAARQVYGESSLVASGPIFESARVEGDQIRIRFSSTGSGLTTRGKVPPDEFQIAGEDRQFVPAEVILEKDYPLVRSSKITKPVAVRFA